MNHINNCREWIATNYPQATTTEQRLMRRGYFAGVHAQIIASTPAAKDDECWDESGTCVAGVGQRT